jgi:hypothetical protein
MNQTYDIDFVTSALHEAGWKPVQTDTHWLLISVEGKHGLFFISFYFHPSHQILAARGNIPIHVPKERESEVLEFINYGNYQIPVGNFEFDVNSQQVYFRVGMFFENIILNAQLLYNVIHEVDQVVQDFWLAIQSVLQNEATIEDAFKTANSAFQNAS